MKDGNEVSKFQAEIDKINKHVRTLRTCHTLYPEMFDQLDWIQLSEDKPHVSVWSFSGLLEERVALAKRFKNANWKRSRANNGRAYNWSGELEGVVFNWDGMEVTLAVLPEIEFVTFPEDEPPTAKEPSAAIPPPIGHDEDSIGFPYGPGCDKTETTATSADKEPEKEPVTE